MMPPVYCAEDALRKNPARVGTPLLMGNVQPGKAIQEVEIGSRDNDHRSNAPLTEASEMKPIKDGSAQWAEAECKRR